MTDECLDHTLNSSTCTRHDFGKHIKGWVNLFWLVTAYYVAHGWYSYYRKTGQWFWPESWILLKLTYRDWSIFGAFEFIMLAYSCLSVLFQKAVLSEIIPSNGILYYIVRQFLQTGVVVGALFVTRWRNWPALQVGTFVAHSLVYYMKMHAFLSTNRKLHHEAIKSKEKSLYPSNLTLSNFIYFLMAPTLLYEPSYPRTPKIRWSYVMDRSAGLMAVFTLLYATIDSMIMPIIRTHPFETIEEKFDALTTLMLPIAWSILLLFFLVFEYLLNWFAELTRFADRHFYDDWWNSLTFAEFARKWNVPVHRFLQQHVYLPCIEQFSMSRGWASFTTFLISSVIHEFILSSMLVNGLKGPRITIFCMQMAQVPLIWFTNKINLNRVPRLANLIFWTSIILGCTIFTLHYSH
jgi:sterol O-acyltransferase